MNGKIIGAAITATGAIVGLIGGAVGIAAMVKDKRPKPQPVQPLPPDPTAVWVQQILEHPERKAPPPPAV